MTDLSHSTATRQANPKVLALVLAAIRLNLRLTPEPKLPLEEKR